MQHHLHTLVLPCSSKQQPPPLPHLGHHAMLPLCLTPASGCQLHILPPQCYGEPVSLSSVQSLSHVRLFATPWTAAHQASLSITNSRSLLKLMSIELVMPSNLCRPLLLPLSIFHSIRIFSNKSVLCIKWPKYWSFSFSISPSNEYSGLISFRMDWLDPRQSKGLLRVFSNTTVQKHQFFSAQLSLYSNSHIHT